MDLRLGQAGGRGYGRGAVRAGACAVTLSLAAALCGAAGTAGASTGAAAGTAGASAGAAAGTAGASAGALAAPVRGAAPAGSPVAKICAEPSPGAVLATGSHRTPAGAPAAAIRVDQVGYPSGAAKLAEIMTKARPSGDLRWVLVRAGSCTVAASGVARQNLGAWSKRYGWVWAARFSQVRAPGRYRVGILGDASAASPWFAIGSAARLYARPLANALYFYENERDGPDFIHTPLRSAPGHLNDVSAMTYRSPPVDDNGDFKGSLAKYATGVRINASGGWFDAGDYLHFVETTSYTEAVLLQGIASFPGQMGAGAGARSPGADFTGEAKFGLDFLQRMWHQRTRTLYYQVGTGEANNYYFGDHDIWRLPQADDNYKGTNPRYVYIRHPPVFRAAQPQPGRPADRRLRAVLPGLPRGRPGLRGPLPDRGEDRVFAGQHALEGPADDGHPVRLLPGDELEGRHDAGRHRTGHRGARRGPPGYRLPARRRALGQRLDPQQAGAVRHAEPVRRQRAGRLRARPGAARPARRRAGGDQGAAAGQPARADRAGHPHRGQRPVPVRLRLGPVGHHHARRRADRDGRRVRRADRAPGLRGLGAALAGRHPGRQRLGCVADRRGRHRVPGLH